MRGYFSVKSLFVLVIFSFSLFFSTENVFALDVSTNECCAYFEGSDYSATCLSLSDDTSMDCADSNSYYQNMKGGYDPSEPGTCIEVSGYFPGVYIKGGKFCQKAKDLNSATGFLVKLLSARADDVAKKLDTFRNGWCCYNPVGSCKEFSPHAPFVREDVISQIRNGVFDASMLSPDGGNVEDFISCNPSGSVTGAGVDSDWKRYAGSCSALTDSGEKLCDSTIEPIRTGGTTASVIDTAKILKAEARSTLNPMNFKTGAAGVNDFIGRVIAALTFTMGSLLLLFYVYAGVLWMTSAGSSERVGKAKQIAIWSTLGVIVVLASYAIVTILFKFAG